MLFKYSGKYVNIYFNMKITFYAKSVENRYVLIHLFAMSVVLGLPTFAKFM